jgi:hypothetical protein
MPLSSFCFPTSDENRPATETLSQAVSNTAVQQKVSCFERLDLIRADTFAEQVASDFDETAFGSRVAHLPARYRASAFQASTTSSHHLYPRLRRLSELGSAKLGRTGAGRLAETSQAATWDTFSETRSCLECQTVGSEDKGRSSRGGGDFEAALGLSRVGGAEGRRTSSAPSSSAHSSKPQHAQYIPQFSRRSFRS